MGVSCRALAGGFAVAALLVPIGTRAQKPPAESPPAAPPATSSSAPATEDPKLVEAKELNRQGIALLEAGDVERALDYFQRSRAAYPSAKNVANVAICLDRLGRYDEALELYEELLVKYAAGLDDEDRAAIAPAMAALRRKVGSLVVSSNAGGSVVVDGRPRGQLPRPPIRVLGGKRLVRVIKDGYRPFEKEVVVDVGATLELDARLEPLAGVGLLRVEDPSGAASDVFIDRVRVGTTPWEGTLAAGKHVVWTRGDKLGSAPAAVTVLQGQTALVRTTSRSLGPPVRLRPVPPTAEIEIDGTSVGAGTWDAPLPVGEHRIVVSEPGYRVRTATIVEREGGEPIDLTLKLEVDPNDPRWPKPTPAQKGVFWIEAFAGYAGASSLGGDADACPKACSDGDPVVHGLLVGARGGYRFPFGLSFEFVVGYLTLASSFDRRESSRFGESNEFEVAYDLHDQLRVSGPFIAAGPSYRLPVAKRFGVVGRIVAGALFAFARDPVDGMARTNGPETNVVLADRNETIFSTAFFFMPAVGADAKLGSLDVGLSFGAAIFPGDGPTFGHENLQAQPNQDFTNEGAVGNASATDAIANERAYGAFVAWVPSVSVGYTF
jgi:hypothetical protein